MLENKNSPIAGRLLQLVAITGDRKGTAWVLDRRGLLVGRDDDTNITIDDPIVSRRHCHITQLGEEVHLDDLGSRNPVLLNGSPVRKAVLRVGDELSIGKARFLVSEASRDAVAPAGMGNAPETRSWAKADYVSVALDRTPSGKQVRPHTIEDLVVLHDLARELGHCDSLACLFGSLRKHLLERFRPAAVWIAQVRGRDELTFVEGDEGQGSTAPTEIIHRALEERRGLLAPIVRGVGKRGATGTVLISPVRLAGVNIAAVALHTELPKNQYDEDDLRMLVAVCQVLGPIFRAVESIEQSRRDGPSAAADVDRSCLLVGTSKAMCQVRNQIERSAKSALHVLLTGETGTGKDLAARTLHALSDRHAVPMVVVNCASIPRDLFPSMLFGHERGAFTGAHQSSEGLIRHADGGTLFLDEIGDLCTENQAALLRVIETGTYRGVGVGKETRVDVRIIAATNRDISTAIEAGRFRLDLYHRLNGFEIHLPPLRERPSDIPVLAEHFFQLDEGRASHPLTAIAPDAMAYLCSRSWPGNVRELRNCLLRAIMLAKHEIIRVDDVYHTPGDVATETTEDTMITLSEAEKRHIVAVLNQCGGNISMAAGVLQIGRTTLYKKMDDYDIKQ